LHARIMREVIEPTARTARGRNPYLGFLYAGLMMAADGTPNVLEFNCRFGDPETQRFDAPASDLVELCEAALRRRRRAASNPSPRDPRAALGVVMAAGGLPRRLTAKAIHQRSRCDRAAPGKYFMPAPVARKARHIVTPAERYSARRLGRHRRRRASSGVRPRARDHWNL